jgi:hypothetical protein
LHVSGSDIDTFDGGGGDGEGALLLRGSSGYLENAEKRSARALEHA